MMGELCNKLMAMVNGQEQMRCNADKGHEGPHSFTFPFLATNGPSGKLYSQAEVDALIAAALEKAAALRCDGCRAGVTLAFREIGTHDRPGRWHVGPDFEFACTAHDILGIADNSNALAEHDAALITQTRCQATEDTWFVAKESLKKLEAENAVLKLEIAKLKGEV